MKSKVYYDIEKTPHIYNYEGFKLYFSSPNNMRKFAQQIDDYINEQSFYISNRYEHFNCIFTDLFILAFYRKIEKRGFKAIYHDTIEVKPESAFVAQLRDNTYLDYYERED